MTEQDERTSKERLERKLRARYLIAGTIGVASLAASVGFRCALAEGNHNGVAASDREAAERRENTCCSNAYYALRRYNKEVFWRADVMYSFAKDVAHMLNLDEPRQRGAYTDGGPIMGSGARELRGPGGTIGPI